LKRLHRRLFRLNDRITELEEEMAMVSAELEFHRAINSDAQRDAGFGNYIDREEAGLTAADVRRFERNLALLNMRWEKAVSKRDQLLGRLPG
jgi:hypothetical protein